MDQTVLRLSRQPQFQESFSEQEVDAMATLSRREMFAGTAAMLGAACLAPGNTALAEDSEYMLAPGLVYLNTGSLGPTPRSTLNAVLKAWNDLEMNPVNKAYGETVNVLADKTRDSVAGLIGCLVDEVLLTRSTTNAMTIAGLGVELSRGDRVLTTDVEHEGGSAVWKHLEKRRGIGVDRIVITPEDHDVKGIVEADESDQCQPRHHVDGLANAGQRDRRAGQE
jgi:hypothetical protein